VKGPSVAKFDLGARPVAKTIDVHLLRDVAARAKAQHSAFPIGEPVIGRKKKSASAKLSKIPGAPIVDDAGEPPFASEESAEIAHGKHRRHFDRHVQSPSSPAQDARALNRCRALIAAAKLIG